MKKLSKDLQRYLTLRGEEGEVASFEYETRGEFGEEYGQLYLWYFFNDDKHLTTYATTDLATYEEYLRRGSWKVEETYELLEVSEETVKVLVKYSDGREPFLLEGKVYETLKNNYLLEEEEFEWDLEHGYL